jgi:hypothetical protein
MTPLLRVTLRLAAGGWVTVCRKNAETLQKMDHVEVQYMRFQLRTWTPMGNDYMYAVRMKFRARYKPHPDSAGGL